MKIRYKIGLFVSIGIVVTILTLFILNYLELADWFFGSDKSGRGELLKVLMTFIGGVGVVISLVIAYLGYVEQKKQTSHQGTQVNLAQEQVYLQKMGLGVAQKQNRVLEDGFLKTILHESLSQLDSKSPIIVKGAIESLHILAKENERYRETVQDIFCSFLRERSFELYDEELRTLIEICRKDNTWEEVTLGEWLAFNCPTEIQTIINYLFYDNPNIYQGMQFNLNGAVFVNVVFGQDTKTIMSNVQFKDCLFIGCKFCNDIVSCQFFGRIECSRFFGEIKDCMFFGVVSHVPFWRKITNTIFYNAISFCSFTATNFNSTFYYEYKCIHRGADENCNFGELSECQFQKEPINSKFYYQPVKCEFPENYIITICEDKDISGLSSDYAYANLKNVDVRMSCSDMHE